MKRVRRPSPQTLAVLGALACDPTDWRYGYELCQQLDIKPGSMYPILMRLADRGLLETAWERDPQPGRPPRHLYRLSDEGRVHATALTTNVGTTTRLDPRPGLAPANGLAPTRRLAR